MTDETEAIPAADPEPDKGVSLIQLWAIYYETALSFLQGDRNSIGGATLNRADRQQYSLKAADVALGLAQIQTGLNQ